MSSAFSHFTNKKLHVCCCCCCSCDARTWETSLHTGEWFYVIFKRLWDVVNFAHLLVSTRRCGLKTCLFQISTRKYVIYFEKDVIDPLTFCRNHKGFEEYTSYSKKMFSWYSCDDREKLLCYGLICDAYFSLNKNKGHVWERALHELEIIHLPCLNWNQKRSCQQSRACSDSAGFLVLYVS